MASLKTDEITSLNMNIFEVCFRNDSSYKHANESGYRQGWGNGICHILFLNYMDLVLNYVALTCIRKTQSLV